MPLSRLLVATLLLACLATAAGLGWWWQTTSHSSATQRALAGVTFIATQTAGLPTLRPSVVTAATKLGQGRRAVADMARTNDYALPVLRDSAAGLALQIPNTALPARAAYDFSAQIQSPTPANPANNPGLRFDMYSWSEGILVATAQTPIHLQPNTNFADVPDALESLASQFGNHRRLLLVLPIGTTGLPVQLNQHDAYVLVVERTN